MKIDGTKLQAARKKLELSTTQLAAKVDLSGRTIERYEAKGANVNEHLAKAISRAVGVKLEELR